MNSAENTVPAVKPGNFAAARRSLLKIAGGATKTPSIKKTPIMAVNTINTSFERIFSTSFSKPNSQNLKYINGLYDPSTKKAVIVISITPSISGSTIVKHFAPDSFRAIALGIGVQATIAIIIGTR
jgi:hypothetical protein